MAFIPEQRSPLVFGIVSALVMMCGYLWRRRFARRLIGFVAVHGRAVHRAPLRQIVRNRVVLSDPVVPEGHVIDLP